MGFNCGMKILILTCLLTVTMAKDWGNYSQLLKDLFTDYSIQLRPVLDGSTQVNMSVGLAIQSLDSISEKEQTMTTNGWLSLSWTNEKMAWDTSSYNGIDELMVQQQSVWLPDIVVKNSVTKRKMIGYNEQPVVIYNDGVTLWYPGDIFETSCDLQVYYYPFDTQTCKVVVNLWLSLDYEITLTADGTTVDTSYYSDNGQWLLVSTSAEEDGENGVVFSLVLKRRQLYYLVNVLIPVVFLSILGPFIFVLPADSGEKMGFGVTVLLSYMVFLTILGNSMPQTSTQTSLMSLYLTFMMAITAFSVVISSVLLRLYHKSDDIPMSNVTRNLCSVLRRLFCLGHTGKRISRVMALEDVLENKRPPSTATSVVPEIITWKLLAETLDIVLLSVTSILTLLCSIIFLTILIGGL